MTFKDLIMQTSFEEIVAEYKRLLHSHGHLYTKHEKAILRIIFEKLRTMEPVENKNMTIWAGRYNVNGYEEGNPYAYSLVSTPWKDWLGMEIDAYLLENVRHAAIIVSCIWEMSYWGIEDENGNFITDVEEDEEDSDNVETEEDVMDICLTDEDTSIVIPSSTTLIVNENLTHLESIVVAEENKVYDSRDNCNAIIETATNSLIAGCKSTVIPDTVTEIFDRAFLGCDGLTEIIIPESVTEIGWFAFRNCKNLTSVVLPDSVKMIWPGAFDVCDSLKSIIVPSGSAERYKDMLSEELHDKIKERIVNQRKR